jgi:hypothetical protein
MRVVDSYGMEWEVDLDGTLIDPNLPPWPMTDDGFLKLCCIELWEEVDADVP